MNEDNDNDELNESSKKYEIKKLKKLLKHVERLIKKLCQTRKRFGKMMSKLTWKINKLIEMKDKCVVKIEKLRERKKLIRIEILERQRINLLVRRKRLERLKQMSKYIKSLRKIYLKEVKSVKKIQKHLKKSSKPINPTIKKIIIKIDKLSTKRDLADKKIQKLTSKIEKVKKRINSLGIRIRALRLKARRIRYQLDQLINTGKYEVYRKPRTIIYEATPETKIVEFKYEQNNAIPVRVHLHKKGVRMIKEPVPIGDKKSTGDSSSSKKKIFIKRRKKSKIEEPLPIGDKIDVEEKAEPKRKRRGFFRRSRRSLKSDSEPKTPTSDSDVNGDVQHKRVLHKKKLHKRRVSTDSHSTEPITSLKTTTTDNDSDIFNTTSQHKHILLNEYQRRRLDPSLKSDFFKKPVDRGTLQPITIPERRKTVQIQIEDENGARKSRLRTRLTKSSVVYDDTYYQNLVKTHKPSIREKIRLERKKALLEQQKWEQEEAEKSARRESMERRATIRKSRATLLDIDPLETLVEMGLKSKFVLTDIIPTEVPVVDAQILKIASQSKGLRGMLSTKKIYENHSSESVSSLKKREKKSKNKKLVIDLEPHYGTEFKETSKKSVQIADRPILNRKSATTEDDSDDETLVAVSDLWQYNEPTTDLQSKRSSKIDKSKHSQMKKHLEVKDPLKSYSQSDGEEVVEHVLKAVCSACGMTDMTLGGFCCPLKPKTQ